MPFFRSLRPGQVCLGRPGAVRLPISPQTGDQDPSGSLAWGCSFKVCPRRRPSEAAPHVGQHHPYRVREHDCARGESTEGSPDDCARGESILKALLMTVQEVRVQNAHLMTVQEVRIQNAHLMPVQEERGFFLSDEHEV